MTLKSKRLLNFLATLEQLLGVLSSNFCWIYQHNLFIPRCYGCARTPPKAQEVHFFVDPLSPFPLFYSPHFFARSLTLVPRSLLPNRKETLDTQAITEATDGLLPITRVGSRILFVLKENKVCIVPFLCGPLSKISAVFCGQKQYSRHKKGSLHWLINTSTI